MTITSGNTDIMDNGMFEDTYIFHPSMFCSRPHLCLQKKDQRKTLTDIIRFRYVGDSNYDR